MRITHIGAMDDVRYLVLQCPNSEAKREAKLFLEIRQIADGSGVRLFESTLNDLLPLLLGRPSNNLSTYQMEHVWKITGRNIHEMHRANLHQKEGIG